jgi:hypothetical protein
MTRVRRLSREKTPAQDLTAFGAATLKIELAESPDCQCGKLAIAQSRLSFLKSLLVQ